MNVRILNEVYEVRVEKFDGSADGRLYPLDKLIVIQSDSDIKEAVLIHEMMHAMLFELGRQDLCCNEEYVCKLTEKFRKYLDPGCKTVAWRYSDDIVYGLWDYMVPDYY